MKCDQEVLCQKTELASLREGAAERVFTHAFFESSTQYGPMRTSMFRIIQRNKNRMPDGLGQPAASTARCLRFLSGPAGILTLRAHSITLLLSESSIACMRK